jgi:hypothetical protein
MLGLSQHDAPVDGDPTHNLGVHEVLRLTANLPDPVVRLGPPAGRHVHQPMKEIPVIDGRRALPLIPSPGKLQQLTIDVELYLRGRVISHSDRSSAPVTVEVGEFVFRQSAIAVDPIHDL